MKMQGPNVKRLIVHQMSLIMVPPGGGLAAAIESLVKPSGIGDAAKRATVWADDVPAVRRFPIQTQRGAVPLRAM